MSEELEKLVPLKKAAESGLFPVSYSMLRQLAEAGKIPAYSITGKGSRRSWFCKISELYQSFIKGGLSGQSTIPQRSKKMGSRLSGRWT